MSITDSTETTLIESGETTESDRTTTAISLAEMDNAIANIRELEASYKAAKEISDGFYEQLQAAKAKVVEMLEQAGKTTYIAEGIGRVKVTYEMSVQTPKTPEEKKAFFTWLATNMGPEVSEAYMTVNSQSLNALYNQLTEEYARRGEVLMIDGLSEPISRTKLSLTKA
jgi:hypothetical protein